MVPECILRAVIFEGKDKPVCRVCESYRGSVAFYFEKINAHHRILSFPVTLLNFVSRRRWSNRTIWMPSTRRIPTRPMTLVRTKTTTMTMTTLWRRKRFLWRGTRWCLPRFLTRRQRGCPFPKACRGLLKSGAALMPTFFTHNHNQIEAVLIRYWCLVSVRYQPKIGLYWTSSVWY